MNSGDLIILISLISMGFFGGFSHCLGMCGPFVLTQVSNNLSRTKIDDFKGLKKLSKIALTRGRAGVHRRVAEQTFKRLGLEKTI